MAGRKILKNVYHVIVTNHGKQIKDVFWTDSYEKVKARMNAMIKESDAVLFPKRLNSMQSITKCEYELMLIKYVGNSDERQDKVKNEYGRYVKYETDNKDWIVIERESYNIEESFIVYGHHPKTDRKDFRWIAETFFDKGKDDKYGFKEVVLYNNKILISEGAKLDIVICKDKNDCIRLYNALSDYCLKNHLKYEVFMGDIAQSHYKRRWLARIKEVTGWNSQKIRRQSTRSS